jgi:foldase protein PrsA
MNLISASLSLLLAARAAAAPAPAGDRELVRVNGVPIRESEVVERLLKRYGQQTVEDMVNDILLREAAKAKPPKGVDAEVDRRVAKLQSQFASRELFLSKLEQAHSTLSQLKAQLEEEVVQEKLVAESENLTVADEEVKQFFNEHKDRLKHNETVHLRHILVASADEAKDIAAQIKGGADFGKIAGAKSLASDGKVSGGDLGFVGPGLLPPKIEEAAFAMKAGDVSVVSDEHGASILQVVEKKPARDATYSEVKDDLRELLMTDKIKKAAPHYIAELRRKADIQVPSSTATSSTGKP